MRKVIVSLIALLAVLTLLALGLSDNQPDLISDYFALMAKKPIEDTSALIKLMFF